MKIINKTHEEILIQINTIASYIIYDFNICDKIKLYGVPRGGVSPCYLVYGVLFSQKYFTDVEIVDHIEDANIIIDDLIDSGETERKMKEKYPDKKFYALFRKMNHDEWFVFPWEKGIESSINDIILRISQISGVDTETTENYLKSFIKSNAEQAK